jgi:antitoxin MazE
LWPILKRQNSFSILYWIYNISLYIHQEIIMQVAKWGNSLGVRLPVALVQELGISEGDDVQVVMLSPKTATSAPSVQISKEPTRQEIIAEIGRKYRGRWPVGLKFDREEANSR